MIDVEFISQYLLLRYAPQYKDLVLWTDNVRILEEANRIGVISDDVKNKLITAYIDIRTVYHQLSLADLPRLLPLESRIEATHDVEKIWNELFK
ncbi:MAG: hypothetical protein ACI4M9_05195, partial [Succinivibrio sp.]